MNTSLVYDDFGGFGFGFGLMGAIFPIFFIFIIGIFIYGIAASIKQAHKNNMSPVLIVEAEIVSKRTDVSHHHHNNMDNNNFSDYSTSTTYYATFQVESGDRIEFHVNGGEYGILAEGDKGKLKFQGTRYLGFTRI